MSEYHLPPSQQVWSWQGPGQLELHSKELGAPQAGEVIVANQVIGLNPVDWKMIERGHPDWQPGHIPGVDGMGIVVARGAGVSLPLGSRVAYHQWLKRDGSFAPFTRLAAGALLQVPQGVADEQAAALPCPALTAWQAQAKVPDAGQRDVLITGAGGAVGMLLVQLAVARGWRVWVTAAPRHHGPLSAMGVSGSFDYRDSQWREALQAALGERRLYALFDTVSGEHARSLAPLLGYNGHLVCIQDRLEQAPLPAFGTALSCHEVALGSMHDHASAADWVQIRQTGRQLLEQLRDGNLTTPALHLDDYANLPRALAAVKAGQGGKWLIKVDHAPLTVHSDQEPV